MKKIKLTILLLCCAEGIFAQSMDREDSLLSVSEEKEYIGEQYVTSNQDFVIEHADAQLEFDLNRVDSMTLLSAGFFTAAEIHEFLNYRNVVGYIDNVISMQAIPGWSIISLQHLKQLSRSYSPSTFKNLKKMNFSEGEHRLQIQAGRNLELEDGFKDTLADGSRYFSGSPYSYHFRYRYKQQGKWQMAFVSKKDAGEKYWKSKICLPDYYSWHFNLKGEGLFRQLIVGDFQVNAGQGLITWELTAFGKSSNVLSVKREQSFFTPYQSLGTSSFERGVACEMQHHKIALDIFVSSRKHDATIYKDSSGYSYFQSLQTSGLHRTVSEITGMSSVTRYSGGIRFKYQDRVGQFGWTMLADKFSLPWKKGDDVYQLFAPAGSHFYHASIDYAYTYKNAHFFGEEAWNGQGVALSNGALLSLSKTASVAILHRRFDPMYRSFFDNAVQEDSHVGNESGFYIGFQFKPNQKYEFNAYADFFRFPWLRYGNPSPSFGKDLMMSCKIQLNKENLLFFRLRTKAERTSTFETTDQYCPFDFLSSSLLMHVESHMSTKMTFKSRIEVKRILRPDCSKGLGLLIFADFKVKSNNSKMEAECRLNIYKTDSYDSRLYAFEPGVSGTGLIKGYDDQGCNAFMLIHIKPVKNLKLSFKYTLDWKWLTDSRGEGYDRILGNRKSTLQASLSCIF